MTSPLANERRDPAGFGTLSSAMVSAHRYNRWVLAAFNGAIGRRVVEAGCGYGQLRALLPDNVDYLGVDADPDVLAAAAGRGGEFVQAKIEMPEFVARVAPWRPDTVLCVNVLEHVEDHRAAVANMLAVLPVRGRLLLFVPAFPKLYNDLDRVAGHRRRYRVQELPPLLNGRAEVEKLEYFNPVGAAGWWLNKLLRHNSLERQPVTAQVRLFERWGVPLSRALNPLTRRRVGQSIVCVARKR